MTPPNLRLGISAREHAALAFILAREGGFVNDAADRGGPTNMGITLAQFSEWTGKVETAETLRTLDVAEARSIYLTEYVDKPGIFNIVDDTLFLLLFDSCVLNGRLRTVKWLQRATGQVEDGILGPVTLAVVNNGDPYWVFMAERLRAFGALLSARPTQARFAAGWMNRLALFLDRDKVRDLFVQVT